MLLVQWRRQRHFSIINRLVNQKRGNAKKESETWKRKRNEESNSYGLMIIIIAIIVVIIIMIRGEIKPNRTKSNQNIVTTDLRRRLDSTRALSFIICVFESFFCCCCCCCCFVCCRFFFYSFLIFFLFWLCCFSLIRLLHCVSFEIARRYELFFLF